MTTKSFAEQVNDIKNARMSKAAKKAELVKLGITKYECDVILSTIAKRKLTITFGVEIETFGAGRYAIEQRAQANGLPLRYMGYTHEDSRTMFKLVTDGSIVGGNGIECVTPILSGRSGFAALENACATLNEAGAQVNKSTGLHVHIGAERLSVEQYINVFVNYQMMEAVIDSFMANSRRRNNNRYCRSLVGYDLAGCHTRESVWSILGNTRYRKVNPESFGRHKTIEFRQHQGSTDFTKIKAWVNFCAKLVTWSLENRMTAPIGSIEDIPFLNGVEKAFFSMRKRQLA